VGTRSAHGANAQQLLGTLVAFTTLQVRLFAPIGSLLSISVDVQSSLALFDRIFEYSICRSTSNRGRARSSTSKATFGSSTFGSVMAASTRGRSKDVDVDIPAGTTTAIVGETGAGQDDARLPRLAPLRRHEGRVIIDGVDIRELTFASLASAVGVVSQETYLFNSTVRENLRFAKTERE